jgi:hypothetical protein
VPLHLGQYENMEIRIGNSSEYLLIRDILPEYDSKNIDFLRGTIQLQMNGISSNIGATIRLNELKQLLTDIEQLYKTLKHEFEFKSLEDNIELIFTPTPNGQINIKGLLRNRDYTGSINFEIETDQSYLPGTIDNLKELFNEIKIE